MPVNNPYELIQQLMNQNADLVNTVADLNKTITDMSHTINELNQTIAELKEQINKNSQNSSKPPSSDGLKKPPVNKDRSIRGKRGAQKGHEGVHLAVISDPDFVEKHMHSDCNNCPMCDACLEKTCVKETRHLIDAEVTVNVTVHNLISVDKSPVHGGEKTGAFPARIKATVQYGKNLQSMVVAFNTIGAVSINRTHEILSGVFNIPLSTGTIKNMVTRCADAMSGAYERIRQTMITLGLIHCDETGTRVDGKTWWVHNASNNLFTYLTINQKRSHLGMDAADILPHYKGIIVHDCWASYWKYEEVKHAICCVHLLRELNGIIENHSEQTWAVSFKNLLLEMKKVLKAVINDKDELSYYHLHKFDTKYDSILKTAYKENPLTDESPKMRGRKKKKQSIEFDLQTG